MLYVPNININHVAKYKIKTSCFNVILSTKFFVKNAVLTLNKICNTINIVDRIFWHYKVSIQYNFATT